MRGHTRAGFGGRGRRGCSQPAAGRLRPSGAPARGVRGGSPRFGLGTVQWCERAGTVTLVLARCVHLNVRDIAADHLGSGGAIPPGPTSPGSPARGGTSLRDVRSRLWEVHRARRTGASRPLALLQARGPSRRKPDSGVPSTVAPRRGPESSPRPRAARPVWVKDGRAGRSLRAPSGFRGSRLPPASDMKRRL